MDNNENTNNDKLDKVIKTINERLINSLKKDIYQLNERIKADEERIKDLMRDVVVNRLRVKQSKLLLTKGLMKEYINE